ncbi:MAG: hypothetical protein CVT95_04475, partial [Bacteroidetes bacterium HGW-Bacteroidetes-12]
MKPSVAILFFTRTAQQEAKEKHWLGVNQQQKNNKIAAKLIDQTAHFLNQLHLPVFVFNEENQVGNTFGERFSNAYQEIFNKGFDAVISVGNDTPGLPQINWNEAVNQLQNNQCVLGPSFNGGAYFVGITKNAFENNAFKNLPWQQNELFFELLSFCENNSKNSHETLKKLLAFIISGLV